MAEHAAEPVAQSVSPSAGTEAEEARMFGRPINELLSDFRIVSKLGEGGMGMVYRAHQLSMDRHVALKLLPPHLAQNHDFVERFYREARMSAKLDHPNIVRGLAVGNEQGVHYFAMEFVDGDSLDKVQARVGTLAVGDAVRIILDVAHALDHAHSRGLVHRDIKPANIIITRDHVVKLLDLGLAKQEQDDSGLTQFGDGFGSPPYMAPEQARNAKTADHRSDIFALGVTLYNLLTCKKPFLGETAWEVQDAKEHGRYIPAQQHNPAVPESLERVIAKMVAADPAKRFQDAAQLIPALEGTGLASQRLNGLDSGADATVMKPLGRSRTTTPTTRIARPAMAAVLVLGLAVGSYVAWHYVAAPAPAPVTQPVAPPAAPPPQPAAEAADTMISRAVQQIVAGKLDAARATLAQGVKDHPQAADLTRLLGELEHGVAVLFQYQTPEESSPVLPLSSAQGVTLTRLDNYRFAIVPSRACYVYAFQRDTRPNVFTIFPNAHYSSRTNPLAPEQVHWLPDVPTGTESWMHLDASVGEERVYFLATTKPLRDTEDFGQRLQVAPDRFQATLAQTLSSFLQSDGPPGEPCFAQDGAAMQMFAFNHK
jgi:predicted Ser/Thr protein kinase